MPFTPYHFGPHAAVSLPLQRHLDVPVFVGANIAIDMEPLLVLTLNLKSPLHGYAHTFLIGGVIGALFAVTLYPLRGLIGAGMKALRLPYAPTLKKMVLSGILGAWMHILFDAPLYLDIKPFYPLQTNPLYGILSLRAVYGICIISFLPALLLYIYTAFVAKEGQ